MVFGFVSGEASATDSVLGGDAVKLAKILLDDENYRARAQAAYSLRDYPGPETEEALLFALADVNEAVRLGALSSLAKVGGLTALADIRLLDEENHVVRDQLHRTIVALEEKFPEARAPVEWSKVDGAVEMLAFTSVVDGQGNLAGELRKYLARHLRMQSGLAVVQSLDKVMVAKNQISFKPLFITGSLLSLRKSTEGNEVLFEAVVSIAVLDYPGKTIRFVLTNRASIRRPAKQANNKQSSVLRSSVLERAMSAIAEELRGRLEDF